MLMSCLCRLEGVRRLFLSAALPTAVTVGALLAVLVFASELRAEAVYFDGPFTYATGSSPRHLVSADFNNDGKPDLAVANSGTVSILMNNGAGGFAPTVSLSAGSSSAAITAADFNGDGKQDVAVTNPTAGKVSILLGNGNGTFQPKVDYVSGGDLAVDIVTGDFNGDGAPDLAIAHEGSSTVCVQVVCITYPCPCVPQPPDYTTSANISVLLGNGDGTFQSAARYSIAGRPEALAAADLDSDGRLDLAAVNVTTRKVSILAGLGNGSFQSPISVGSTSDVARDILVTDLNGDGVKDLVVVNDSNLSVLMGVGQNNYVAGFSTYLYSGRSVTAGDFDADGHVDLAVTQESGGDNLLLLLGKGDGTFLPELYAAGSNPRGIAAADFDNNGRLDMAIAISSNNTSIFLNKGLKIVSPTSATFSGMKLNVPSVPKTFVIKNSTAATLTISSLTLTGTDSSMFAAAPGGETPCPSLNPTLGPNESCTMQVVFTPTAFYERKASLVITTDGPEVRTETVKLSGQASPYRVDIAWSGAGSGSVFVNPGSVTYTTGPAYRYYYSSDPVILTAQPGSGSLFGSWTSCDTVAGVACTLAMNSDKSVTVRFNPSTVLVTTSVVSGPGTIIPASVIIPYGGTQGFSIVPGTDYALQELTDNGTAVSPVPDGAGGYTYTVTNATENHSLQAGFTPAPPDTIITSGPSSITRETSFSFTFTSTIAGSTFECDYNGAGYRSCSSPYAPLFFAPLSDGRYTFSVRAISPAGVYDPTPATRTWTIDTMPPSGSVAINGGATTTPSRNVTLTINASATIPGMACVQVYPFICGFVDMQLSNDGSTWTAWEPARTSVTWQLTEWDGPKTVQVRLRDSAGNMKVIMKQITLAVPSSSAVTYPVSGTFLNARCITITGTASAAYGKTVSKVDVSTDGGTTWSVATGAATWSYPWCPAADGNYTIISRAVDSTGMIETTGAGTRVTIDRTPPSGTLAFGSSEFILDATDGGNCVLVYPNICGYVEMLLSSSTTWQPASVHVPLGISHLWLRDRAGNLTYLPAPGGGAGEVSWTVGSSDRIQDALYSVPSGTDVKVSASPHAEDVFFNRDGTFRVLGGYDATFSVASGSTPLTGRVLISAGAVSLAKVAIRGDVVVTGGSLEANEVTIQ